MLPNVRGFNAPPAITYVLDDPKLRFRNFFSPFFSLILALMSYFCRRPVDHYPFSSTPLFAIFNQEAIGGNLKFVRHCLVLPPLAVLLVDITVPLLPMIILLCPIYYDLDCDSSIAVMTALSL